MTKAKYLIISDGACSGNPGPGGYGVIIVSPENRVFEAGGAESDTTNNRMELYSVYRGLQEVYRMHRANAKAEADHAGRVRLISDSKYVLDGVEKSVHVWRKNNWTTSTGTEVKNQDLWEKILKGMETLKDLGFRFEYERVKGHSGHPGNERADEIAVSFSKGSEIDLYSGELSNYPVALFEEMKAFDPCYLSYVSGKLSRHATWDECKHATSGKAGAKFKKVKTLTEEKEVLLAWGVSPRD